MTSAKFSPRDNRVNHSRPYATEARSHNRNNPTSTHDRIWIRGDLSGTVSETLTLEG